MLVDSVLQDFKPMLSAAMEDNKDLTNICGVFTETHTYRIVSFRGRSWVESRSTAPRETQVHYYEPESEKE